ncbi:histone-lysine N-methyltransferase ASHR1-like isoform X2 [Coffea eugenioides]|uniref:histone-lysine N-methyltransferase ASHR1-like isoform X2 n=1 Tax=Coffea eugenioides TaxID=49369 RepID=UPI000F607C51|nr:histone-lysine N-methyltransferase ASHR1-like isoform X2 [Coffea eugenioides]XP_027173610.1 histone-lysine N-methyltransferase ASHR1-like isoform X2 [Coffea eugenioides]
MEELQKALNDGRSLTVSTLPDKGRCLFTSRHFSPGEVIISQEPYVAVPNKNSNDSSSRCEWCLSTRNLKKCSACQVVWYCGSTCQKTDWKLHRLECQVLSKVEKGRIKSLTPSIRLMVKLYLRRKLQVEQLACNAHTICDAELRPLATGLYPVISLINHSCLPNSVLVFEGRLAVVRAVEHIPKGTEVLISYIETAASTMTRQKALKEQYFFTCTCPRCIKAGQYDDIKESAILEGYCCKDNSCSGFLLRDPENRGFVCQECGLLREKEEIKDIEWEVKYLIEKASMCSSGNKIDASLTYKAIEKQQLELCHPFSINLMRTRETLLKIYMELQNWKEALAYCRFVIPIYESK